MSDFEVKGAGGFLKLSKALKDAGRTQMRKELNKRLRTAAKPLIPEARASARETLPKKGGLADLVAHSPMRVQVRTGREAGVRIVVGKDHSGARAANHGEIRHPVFGNRDAWVTQQVPSDWFDRPMRDSAPHIRPELEKAIRSVLEDIMRGAK